MVPRLGSFRRTYKSSRALKCLAGAQNRGRKIWVIDRVGVMLGLQTEPAMLEVIAAVELHSRLRRADLSKISAQFPDYPRTDLLRAIEVSVNALDAKAQERYLGL